MLHVSPFPYPSLVSNLLNNLYGFAHVLQSEAWSLSEGVLVGYIGFDPPTTSTICITQPQPFVVFLE